MFMTKLEEMHKNSREGNFMDCVCEKDTWKAEDSKDSHSMSTCNFKSSEIYSTIVPALVHTTGDITGTYTAVYLPRNTQHPISSLVLRLILETGRVCWISSSVYTKKPLKQCSRRKSLLSQSRCTSNVGVFSGCFGICIVISWALLF